MVCNDSRKDDTEPESFEGFASMKKDTAALREESKNGVRKGFRRHHNNDGRAQIKSGALYRKTQNLAKKLGIPFKP
jgi:hypothetical protein